MAAAFVSPIGSNSAAARMVEGRLSVSSQGGDIGGAPLSAHVRSREDAAPFENHFLDFHESGDRLEQAYGRRRLFRQSERPFPSAGGVLVSREIGSIFVETQEKAGSNLMPSDFQRGTAAYDESTARAQSMVHSLPSVRR